MIIKNERILLVTEDKASALGKYGLPGGKLENGESLEDCAIRECKEETGLDIKLNRLLIVTQKPFTHEGNTVIKFIYEAELTGGESKPELAYAFYDRTSLQDLITADNVRGKDIVWLIESYFAKALPKHPEVIKFA